MAAKPFPVNHDLLSADVNDLTGILDRSTSTVDVVSSTTKTTLWSKVIAAGAMSTDRWLRLRLMCDFLNDTGGAQTPTFNLIFGVSESTLFAPSVAAGANRYAANVEIEIANVGASNSQIWVARVPDLTAPGVKAIEFPPQAMTQDTSVAIGMFVNVTLSANSANLSFRKRAAVLELL